MQSPNTKYSVYAVRCAATGRMYVGCTADVQMRLGNHFSELRNHKKPKQSQVNKKPSGVEWQEDYDKYGEESFEFYILEENVAKNERFNREFYWIKKYDTTNPAKGYNTDCKRNRPYFTITAGLPPKSQE